MAMLAASVLACAEPEAPPEPVAPVAQCTTDADCAVDELCMASTCELFSVVLFPPGPWYASDRIGFDVQLWGADPTATTIDLLLGDGQVVGTGLEEGFHSLDTSSDPEGTYVLWLRATVRGRVAESARVELVVDHTAPTFTVSPAPGPADFATLPQELVVTFSEPIRQDRLPVVDVWTRPVATVAPERAFSEDGRTFTLRLAEPVVGYEQLGIALEGIADRAGNALPQQMLTWDDVPATP